MAIASSDGYLVAMENQNNSDAARPTWFQTSCAMLVMGFSASVVSIALVKIEAVPAVTPGAIFIVVPALLLLITEYLGVFRSNRAALMIAMLLLLFVVVISTELLYSMYRELDRTPNVPGLLPAGIALLLCVMSVLSLRANWQQHVSLKLLQQQGHSSPRGNVLSLKELLAATLLLAFMLGPVAIRAGQNQSMYAKNLSPRDVPFAASPTARNITMSRNRDGSIQAVWTEDESELQDWLDSQESHAEVDGFLSVDKPRTNTTVRIPRPPKSLGGSYDEETLKEGRIVFWDIEDRHIHITWSVNTQSRVAKVYYRESQRE